MGYVANFSRGLSFLTARRQQVFLNGGCSDWIDVASGVPQGTVLGPLLFLVYINDLPDAVQCPLRMFADGKKLFTPVTNDQEVSELQSDIDALAAWSRTWLMPFNEEKCKVLHIGPATLGAQYTMGDTLLNCVEVEKDLGVHIDSELKLKKKNKQQQP